MTQSTLALSASSLQTVSGPSQVTVLPGGRNRSAASWPERSRSALAVQLADLPPEERAGAIVAACDAGHPLDLAGADLRGIDLSARGVHLLRRTGGLAPLSLVGADLSRASLCGANLRGVRLREARLDGAVLIGADLAGADLACASLRHAQLTGADLSRADLSFADCRRASLLSTNLSSAVATAVDLREALLHAAVLCRAGLRSADLRWSRLEGASLAHADLRGARFAGALLAGSNMAYAHVDEATDFSFAFIGRTRFDGVALQRAHLDDGIGEELRDLVAARDAYQSLRRTFEAGGRYGDARWAHVRACRMATASHRPDRARRYWIRDWAEGCASTGHGSSGAAIALPTRLRRAACGAVKRVKHALLWASGHVSGLTTAYGTSYGRLLLTLTVVWVLFAVYFQAAGRILDLEHGVAGTGWLASLRLSAASLTPIDAYPLVASAPSAQWVATIEGAIGVILFGALGYVSASRVRRG